MSTIEDIMSSPVITVDLNVTLHNVLELMVENSIGSVLVLDDDKLFFGVVTERDIVGLLNTHSLEDDLMWLWRQPLRGFMKSVDVVTINEKDTIKEAIELMATNQVRRLPVIDDEEVLVGIVTERDLIKTLSEASWQRKIRVR